MQPTLKESFEFWGTAAIGDFPKIGHEYIQGLRIVDNSLASARSLSDRAVSLDLRMQIHSFRYSMRQCYIFLESCVPFEKSPHPIYWIALIDRF